MKPSGERTAKDAATDGEPASPCGVRTSLELWEGCRVTLDRKELADGAIPVKGCSSPDPLRFLEVFANPGRLTVGLPRGLDAAGRDALTQALYPRIPGVHFSIGSGQPQPPYRWGESDPHHICRSFTYNTNAFYRILLNLRDQGRVDTRALPDLLDKACLVLSRLYRLDGGAIMRHVNNNLNMYFISKSMELVVGKEVYDSECQELEITLAALDVAMRASAECAALSTREKMAFAVGRGVSFIEERLCRKGAEASAADRVERDAYAYFSRRLAIDHRDRLLATIDDAARLGRVYTLAVVVDDATETVADLLWVADLLNAYRYLNVTVLVNTAQISINFSSQMVDTVLSGDVFRPLATAWGCRLRFVATYCPFISFQTNYLTPEAASLIRAADAVFIKGANFFETLQLADKETYYAFVVFGPVSRACTGLNDFDAVWAHVPAGTTGYRFSRDGSVERTLVETAGRA